jgi:hypothetical protein
MTALTGKRPIKFDPNLADEVNREYENKIVEPVPEIEGFVHVPSVNLYFSRELAHKNKNWFECHEALEKEGYRMPTIHEFVELLKHARDNDKELYKEITRTKTEWQMEWLDARFTKEKEVWKINYHHKAINGKSNAIVSCKSEDLEPGLMGLHKIDVNTWLDYANTQGLPETDAKTGVLRYLGPHEGTVSLFYKTSKWMNLECNNDPSDSFLELGVRRVYKGEQK